MREHSGVEPETASSRSPDWDRLVTGVLLVALGVVWFLSTMDALSLNWRVLLPVALIAVGLVAIVLALSRRPSDVTGTGIVLAVLVVVAALVPANPSWRIGELEVRPTTVAEVRDQYSHGIGSLTVDLRRVGLEADVDLAVSNGIGELVVQVPEGVALDVDARVGVGSATVEGREANGFNARLVERFPGEGPTVRLDLSAGVGEIRVER